MNQTPQSEPIGPLPADSAPTEPVPVEPASVEPVLTEPVLTEPASVEPVLTEPVAAGPGPSTPPSPAYGHGPEPAVAKSPRLGTVVWGLVILAIGLGIGAVGLGASVDYQVAMILLLGGAGLVLILGSVVAAVRRRPHH